VFAKRLSIVVRIRSWQVPVVESSNDDDSKISVFLHAPLPGHEFCVFAWNELRIVGFEWNKHLDKQFGLSRGKTTQTKEMNEWRLD
jgi:hypothetical protein